MTSFPRLVPVLAAIVGSLVFSAALLAQGTPTVGVAKPIADLSVPVGTASSKVNMKKTFSLTGTPGDVVHIATTLGDVDVQLLTTDAPQTVANFMGYVNRADYIQSFFHRSVPGFIVQGGGFTLTNDQVNTIPTVDPVVNEYKNSNLRGTMAMAKLGGDPNSATDQWFFNLADNSGNLDNQNGGFTVFGQVVGNGMDVVDAIAALKVVDGDVNNVNSPFHQVPVLSSFTNSTIQPADLVYVNSISVLPLLPKAVGDPSLLKVKVSANSNPGMVTPTVNGTKLVLTYSPGVTGTATITLKAKDASKNKAKVSFNVTVQ